METTQIIKPALTFKEAIGACFSEYATFSGRSRRSEYWWFAFFALIMMFFPVIIMGLVSLVLEGKFIMEPGEVHGALTEAIDFILVIALALICLILFIPSLAVQTRRLHDTGRSGWWIVGGMVASMAFSTAELFVLGDVSHGSSFTTLQQAFNVSTAGAIVMLSFKLVQAGLNLAIFVFSLFDSQRGENKYGPSPKYQ